MEINIKQNFIQATKNWYRYVSLDHHKDHDCHWYVGKIYSYGKDTNEWYIEMKGYITEFLESGETEEEVMLKAIKFINNFINK